MRKIVINITLKPSLHKKGSSIHMVLTKFSTLSSIPYPPSIDYLAEIRIINGMPSGIPALATSIISHQIRLNLFRTYLLVCLLELYKLTLDKITFCKSILRRNQL